MDKTIAVLGTQGVRAAQVSSPALDHTEQGLTRTGSRDSGAQTEAMGRQAQDEEKQMTNVMVDNARASWDSHKKTHRSVNKDDERAGVV